MSYLRYLVGGGCGNERRTRVQSPRIQGSVDSYSNHQRNMDMQYLKYSQFELKCTNRDKLVQTQNVNQLINNVFKKYSLLEQYFLCNGMNRIYYKEKVIYLLVITLFTT